MIGDRYLTDVVYGNRNGLLTVRPAPLTLEGEPSAVLFVSYALNPVMAALLAFATHTDCRKATKQFGGALKLLRVAQWQPSYISVERSCT